MLIKKKLVMGKLKSENQLGTYLQLLSGRDTIGEEIYENGFSGELLGPFQSIRVVYGTTIHCEGSSNSLLLDIDKGLITYNGSHYGIFEIFTAQIVGDEIHSVDV